MEITRIGQQQEREQLQPTGFLEKGKAGKWLEDSLNNSGGWEA